MKKRSLVNQNTFFVLQFYRLFWHMSGHTELHLKIWRHYNCWFVTYVYDKALKSTVRSPSPPPLLGKWWKLAKYDNSVKLLPKIEQSTPNSCMQRRIYTKYRQKTPYHSEDIQKSLVLQYFKILIENYLNHECIIFNNRWISCMWNSAESM